MLSVVPSLVGIVLNRFSRDQGFVDLQLPGFFVDFLVVCILCINQNVQSLIIYLFEPWVWAREQ